MNSRVSVEDNNSECSIEDLLFAATTVSLDCDEGADDNDFQSEKHKSELNLTDNVLLYLGNDSETMDKLQSDCSERLESFSIQIDGFTVEDSTDNINEEISVNNSVVMNLFQCNSDDNEFEGFSDVDSYNFEGFPPGNSISNRKSWRKQKSVLIDKELDSTTSCTITYAGISDVNCRRKRKYEKKVSLNAMEESNRTQKVKFDSTKFIKPENNFEGFQNFGCQIENPIIINHISEENKNNIPEIKIIDKIEINDSIGNSCNKVGCSISWLESGKALNTPVKITNGIVYELSEFSKKIAWEPEYVVQWILRLRSHEHAIPSEDDLKKVHLLLKRRKALSITLAGKNLLKQKLQSFDMGSFSLPTCELLDIKKYSNSPKLLKLDIFDEKPSFETSNVKDHLLCTSKANSLCEPKVHELNISKLGITANNNLCETKDSSSFKPETSVYQHRTTNICYSKTKNLVKSKMIYRPKIKKDWKRNIISMSKIRSSNSNKPKVKNMCGSEDSLLYNRKDSNLQKAKDNRLNKTTVQIITNDFSQSLKQLNGSVLIKEEDRVSPSNIVDFVRQPIFDVKDNFIGDHCDANKIDINILNSNKKINCPLITNGMVYELYYFFKERKANLTSLVNTLFRLKGEKPTKPMLITTMAKLHHVVKVLWEQNYMNNLDMPFEEFHLHQQPNISSFNNQKLRPLIYNAAFDSDDVTGSNTKEQQSIEPNFDSKERNDIEIVRLHPNIPLEKCTEVASDMREEKDIRLSPNIEKMNIRTNNNIEVNLNVNRDRVISKTIIKVMEKNIEDKINTNECDGLSITSQETYSNVSNLIIDNETGSDKVINKPITDNIISKKISELDENESFILESTEKSNEIEKNLKYNLVKSVHQCDVVENIKDCCIIETKPTIAKELMKTEEMSLNSCSENSPIDKVGIQSGKVTTHKTTKQLQSKRKIIGKHTVAEDKKSQNINLIKDKICETVFDLNSTKGNVGKITRGDIVYLYTRWLKKKMEGKESVFVTDLSEDVEILKNERKVFDIRIPIGTLMSSSVKLFEEFRALAKTSMNQARDYLLANWLEDLDCLINSKTGLRHYSTKTTDTGIASHKKQKSNTVSHINKSECSITHNEVTSNKESDQKKDNSTTKSEDNVLKPINNVTEDSGKSNRKLPNENVKLVPSPQTGNDNSYISKKVKKIIGYRIVELNKKSVTEYRVRYFDQPPSCDAWLEEENLGNGMLLKLFWNALKKQRDKKDMEQLTNLKKNFPLKTSKTFAEYFNKNFIENLDINLVNYQLEIEEDLPRRVKVTKAEVLKIYDNWRNNNKYVAHKGNVTGMNLNSLIDSVKNLMEEKKVRNFNSDCIIDACFRISLMRAKLSDQKILSKYLESDFTELMKASVKHQNWLREENIEAKTDIQADEVSTPGLIHCSEMENLDLALTIDRVQHEPEMKRKFDDCFLSQNANSFKKMKLIDHSSAAYRDLSKLGVSKKFINSINELQM